MDKILVSMPSSNESVAVLEAAANLATSFDAELIVLHIEPAIDARSVFDPAGIPAPIDHLARLRQSHPGLRARRHNGQATSVRSLCDVVSREKPDLIVLARTERGSADNVLSIRGARSLVKRAPCPVLLVAS